MSAQPVILVPFTFEEFNALDVAANGEIAEVATNLRALGPEATMARASINRHLQRVVKARDKLASYRPPGYLELVKAQYQVRD